MDIPDLKPVFSQLRFRHLRIVSILATTRNMHRAAELLNVTQPAATKILQDLEEILGVQIFDRKPRAMFPTDIGQFIVNYANQALADLGRFEKSLQNLKSGGYGALTIGAIMATAPDILPLAIAELKRRRPMLLIEVWTVTSDHLLVALEKGELDLVIGRPTEQRHRAIFDVEPIGNEELWAFVADDHPLANKKNLDLARMRTFPWVVQQKTSPMRQIIEHMFVESDLAPLDNIIETTSIFATLHLVRRAGMISILPRSIVADEISRGGLTRLRIDIVNTLEPYGIIRRRGEQLSKNAEELTAILRELII